MPTTIRRKGQRLCFMWVALISCVQPPDIRPHMLSIAINWGVEPAYFVCQIFKPDYLAFANPDVLNYKAAMKYFNVLKWVKENSSKKLTLHLWSFSESWWFQWFNPHGRVWNKNNNMILKKSIPNHISWLWLQFVYITLNPVSFAATLRLA